MTKTFQMEKVAAIQSKLEIKFKDGLFIIEHQIDANSFEDDDSSIFLSFNKKETKNLIEYYKVDNIEDLMHNVYQHFNTYNSLKRFQDFFERRYIHSTLSESALLD